MYKDLNDYEILYLVADNEDSYDIMLTKYSGLIWNIIRKYRHVVKKMGYEENDLYQICSITLYNTMKNYNGNINSNLYYTYLLKSLENAVLSLIKTNSTNKKRVLNESFSYDNSIGDSNFTYRDIIPDPDSFKYFENCASSDVYINFKNLFSFDVANVLEMMIEGYSYSEISILLEISIYDIRRYVTKIKDKLLY